MPRASLAFLVIDLAFGDCGKGTIVDFLTRRFDVRTVVRFNGGPQAGHNVVTPDGRHHTFAQFGSGSLITGVRTILSSYMLIEPYAMFREAEHLQSIGVRDPLSHLTIDARCLVITPAHQAANRIRELARGANAHGTCGMGIGETVQDSIASPHLLLRAGDLWNRQKTQAILRLVTDLKLSQLGDEIDRCGGSARARAAIATLRDPTWISTAVDVYASLAREASIVEMIDLPIDGHVIFEGAQGVLLDGTHGYHPHTTWSTTTFWNADMLLNQLNWPGDRVRIGVLRNYFTRHGVGPFVTEDNSLHPHLPEPHNDASGWQGKFRVGVFDAAAARYAIEV
ncbi:MAG TPA: adenylosuccinate synthetase, partial [Tepidisphaeraceae bacterium]|nr:adenylosuccinate synthetase [Tepidisphaeraceae bacterium]